MGIFNKGNEQQHCCQCRLLITVIPKKKNQKHLMEEVNFGNGKTPLELLRSIARAVLLASIAFTDTA